MKKLLSVFSLLVLMAASHAATNPPAAPVAFEDFKLVGDLSGDQALFTLTGTARVDNSKGGTLDLLSGAVALTDAPTNPQWRIRARENGFAVVFDHGGKFPMKIKFNAAVRHDQPWKAVEFHVAPRSEEHTSELQSLRQLVCRLLLEKKD